MAKKRGYGHLNRLIHAMFDILEDPNQTPELRVDTGKILLAALERRAPLKRRKSPSELAVERLISGAPKKVTPFTKKPDLKSDPQ